MVSLLGGRRDGLSPHKQAVAAVAAISAAMLLASACVLMAGTGNRVGLLEHVVEPAPFVTAQALAHSPVWRAEVRNAVAAKEAQLHKAENEVGAALKKDMHALWQDKDGNLKEEHTKLHDLKRVEVMKGRYEAIRHALDTAPVLKPVNQASQEAGTKVMDPRSGRVYMLYPYNPAPGGYADADLIPDPLLADDEKTFGNFADAITRNPIYQGIAPDYTEGVPLPQYIPPAETRSVPQALYAYNPAPGGYADAELVPNVLLGDDEKTFGNFADAITRNPIYQGIAADYTEGVPLPQYIPPPPAARSVPQALYAYNPAPGGYADAELVPNVLLGDDEKTFGNFADAITRNPIYQGIAADYTEGVPLPQYIPPPPAARSVPQMLRAIPEAAPHMLVMRDRNGQLRAVDPRAIRGLEIEKMHQRALALARRNAMEHQILAARAQRKKAAQKMTAKTAASKGKTAASKGKTPVKAKGQLEMLATKSMPASEARVWGKVYEPKLQALPGDAKLGASQLSGLAEKEFSQWNNLATKLNKVYDPAEDRNPKHNMPRHDGLSVGKKGNWWAKDEFVGSNKRNDQWWQHDHTNRGY